MLISLTACYTRFRKYIRYFEGSLLKERSGIDFRHQSRGDGLEAVVAETGAGVLGAGIVDGGGIGPVEGTETVGISHRKVNLSAGDAPPWPVNSL